MPVMIERYKLNMLPEGFKAEIMDNKYYSETIVAIDTRNKILTEILAKKCLSILNEGVETNDY